RILIRGVTLRNSPKFAFYPSHCTDITMDHAHIFNEWWAQNGDGIDISACKRVIVYACTVNAGDDGICMKSSGASPDGPSLEDIIVAGCTVYRAHGGFGGVHCRGAATAIAITGLPQMPVSAIYFDGVEISSARAVVATAARDIHFHDVRINGVSYNKLDGD
ncbi:MAG TPA: glycosyl hydrolase family 28 protein, partial [Puia sp.]|nr:glycosyl hydrolase family 28 protein [Puia sp.]